MVDDRLESIMETLISVTNSGILVWRETTTGSKDRGFKRTLESIGEDSTKYEVEVKFNLNGNVWELEPSPSIWIRNKTLPNGQMLVGSYNCNMVVDVRNSIKEKYCSDMKPSIEDIEDILFDIEKGISLSTYRDNELNKIL